MNLDVYFLLPKSVIHNLIKNFSIHCSTCTLHGVMTVCTRRTVLGIWWKTFVKFLSNVKLQTFYFFVFLWFLYIMSHNVSHVCGKMSCLRFVLYKLYSKNSFYLNLRRTVYFSKTYLPLISVGLNGHKRKNQLFFELILNKLFWYLRNEIIYFLALKVQ